MRLTDGREVLCTLALPLPLSDAGPLMAAIGRCAEELGYVDVVYDAVRGGIVARRPAEPAEETL